MRETPGWETIRVQIDPGAIHTVGLQEIAREFEMKEAAMSKRGFGFAVANGSGIKIMERRRSSGTRKMAKESV